MAGRGFLDEAEPLDTLGGRLKMMRNGRWLGMVRPVNPDRKFSGTCLVESFARAYAEDHPDVEVGVIPCADGGTSLDQWQENGLLFDNAVNCARLAQRTSNIVAVLWHQGESDCGENNYPHYYDKLAKIMAALRREIGARDVPLIVGGLGDFLVKREDGDFFRTYVHINAALEKYAQENEYTAFASAVGLESNPDNLHFSARALDEFGKRYYTAFRKIEDKSKIYPEKSAMDSAIRSRLELL